MKPITTIERITPEVARNYMALNLKNRPLSKHKLRALIDAMQKGEWVFNGDNNFCRYWHTA